jgi:F-type H+-transporting ATPase subunit a
MAEEQVHSTQEGHNEDAGHTEAHQDTGHGAPTEITKDNLFPHMLSQLGDHSGFYIWGYKVFDLPKIIIDDSFYFYSSPQAMEEAGVFTEVHHHIVRADNHEDPALNLSPTNLVFFQWMAMFILLVAFFFVGRKYKKNPKKAPSGFQNMIEVLVVFIRDEIVRPNVNSDAAARYLLPYHIGLFFFILTLNLFGLMPGGHTATGALAVTGALAITAYFVINITAIKEAGLGSWLKHLLGGAPVWLAPIMIPIEIISMFVKPFALTIRLFANMTAGHVVLYSLVGLIFFFTLSSGMTAGLVIAPISVAFSVFMYVLELLVALLQAYIFTILVAVFVGLAIGEHGHHHEDAHA